MASHRDNRRLAAILAADIVGYSRLVEADEQRTLAAIRAVRAEAVDPLLSEHHGRIVKLMGDGAIIEFASVVDAVACAVALQKAVAAHQAALPADRRLVFRIGINLGDVVVEGDDLSATVSMSLHGWSSCASPVACSSRVPPTTSSRASSACPWSSPASRRSRTSSGRCAPTACGWTGSPRDDRSYDYRDAAWSAC